MNHNWEAQITRAYTIFGIRRFIPDIDPPDINPEFEKEHPREEKGRGERSGRFERKPRASTDLDTARASLNKGDRVAAGAADVINEIAGRHGMVAEVIQIKNGKMRLNLFDADPARRARQDAEGRVAGRLWRQYHDDKARHLAFSLNKERQGKGFGTDLDAALSDYYRAQGITEILLHANADVGGYAWSKMGYQFEDPVEAEQIFYEMVDEYLQQKKMGGISHPDIERQLLAFKKRFDEQGILPSPIELAMLGHTDGADIWFGKNFMLNHEWSGVKKL